MITVSRATLLTIASLMILAGEDVHSSETLPSHALSPAVPAHNHHLQELGIGIQAFNFHAPVRPSPTGTKHVPSTANTPAQPTFASPNPPSLQLPPQSHMTITPQPIPPPVFGRPDHR